MCLQELFNAPYFCKSLKMEWFDIAEPIPGPTVERLQALARELEIVLIVPIYERQAAGLYRNSAAVIDADGTLLGTYRKMHIPHDPLFEEKYYFAPGDTIDVPPASPTQSRTSDGFRVFSTRYAEIGVLICWDQWYPEGARITALLGADILFYPTAIGWHPAEKATFGADQVTAWRTIQRAHAIANGVFVASPNRVGFEPEPGTDGLEFLASRSSSIRSVASSPRQGRIQPSLSRRAIRRASRRRAATGRFSVTAGSTPTAASSPGTSASRRDVSSGTGHDPASMPNELTPPYRMPAEWEPHDATWIGWPRHEPDWPGNFETIPWVYAEIVRALHVHERVEIICHDESVRDDARAKLDAHGCNPSGYRLHVVPNDRVWLRDSGATGVHDASGRVALAHWAFNAWAKYDNYALDADVGLAMSSLTGLPRLTPMRPDGGGRVVLEGGAIDVNGHGRILVTEECLLSPVQERNPGLDRDGYERVFAEALGARQTLWLGEGCVGDDTHGHVDDIARFVDADTVVVAYEEDPADDNHARSEDNLSRLVLSAGEPLRVIKLPYPRPVIMDGTRLPASYANFYVANGCVLVPTFNDPNDRVALNTLAECFPERMVVGIHSVDLVWGLGTLHCLSQQQPSVRAD
ncbi:MAG: agmatine deiminase family protein [Gemmatimonadaceae bacterium]